MKRITKEHNQHEKMLAIADGNFGAMHVVCELIASDPGGDGDLHLLDEAGIYEDRIWICYKDICDHDIDLMRKKLRAGTMASELEVLEIKYKGRA